MECQLGNHIPISYKGNKSDVEKLNALAKSKGLTTGELVAQAVHKVYGDELVIVEQSLLAMNDRLNERSMNSINKHR